MYFLVCVFSFVVCVYLRRCDVVCVFLGGTGEGVVQVSISIFMCGRVCIGDIDKYGDNSPSSFNMCVSCRILLPLLSLLLLLPLLLLDTSLKDTSV